MPQSFNRLFWRMTLPVPMMLVIGILLLLFALPKAVEWNIKVTAKENALQVARDYRSIRDYYNTFVVNEVLSSGDIAVSHLHLENDSSIPSPATFLKEMTKQRGSDDVSISLVSPFPFISRDEPELDSFQKGAWAALTNNPDEVLVSIDHANDIVRVAIADRMTAKSCVSCHNNHPDSPRHDWNLGDVRGVLEVQSNVGAQLARGTSLSIGLIVALSIGGVFLTVINGLNARTVAKPLNAMSQALLQLSTGKRDFRLPETETTEEVRQLWNAFHAFRKHDEEREALSKQVHALAYYDSLTDLPNRASFRERLDSEITRARNEPGLMIAVMLLDLDHFRDVNNALGHDAGDELLRTLGQRLSELEGHQLLVARISEDEFGVLVCQEGDPVLEQEAASDSVRKIVAAVEEPIEWEEQALSLSGSLGISIYPKDGSDSSALLKHADLALDQAKKEGRRTYRYFTQNMEAEVVKRIQMTRDLRAALENDELYPCFQPQYDVQSGDIIGAELLLRWRQPDGTNISPGEFIPVAEQSGLIVPIGRRILQDACRLSLAWQQAGMAPIRIAVNVSAIEFDQPDFVESVESVLAESGLDPSLLELELTESATMNEVELVIQVMQRLHDMGLALAIDDFGTGYSSLSYLKQLPIDRLKIDQSFVRDLMTDKDDAAIARTIIGLAKNLDLHVIAEGVEDSETLAFLQAEQCDEAQGFYFSRPLPAEEFFDFVLKHQQEQSPGVTATAV